MLRLSKAVMVTRKIVPKVPLPLPLGPRLCYNKIVLYLHLKSLVRKRWVLAIGTGLFIRGYPLVLVRICMEIGHLHDGVISLPRPECCQWPLSSG